SPKEAALVPLLRKEVAAPKREQGSTNQLNWELVLCQSEIDGYRCLSLIDASSAVKRQLIVTCCRLRRAVQAATCRVAVSREANRCDKHCRSSAESSISAMFSQLACLGV